jgi:hypothetical protein
LKNLKKNHGGTDTIFFLKGVIKHCSSKKEDMYWRKCLSCNPNYALAWNYIAEKSLIFDDSSFKQLDSMLYQKILAKDPSNSIYYKFLIEDHHAIETKRDIKKAISIDSTNLDAYLLLYEYFKKHGENDSIKFYINTLRRFDRIGIKTNFLLADRYFLEFKDTMAALKCIDKYLVDADHLYKYNNVISLGAAYFFYAYKLSLIDPKEAYNFLNKALKDRSVRKGCYPISNFYMYLYEKYGNVSN